MGGGYSKLKPQKKARKTLIIVVLFLIIIIGIGVSYAYFSMSGVSDKTISFRAGACLNITITEETDAISLENVYPSTVEQGLNNTPYTFHIENMCPNEANYQISLESLNQQVNTLESQFLQASLELENGRRITNKLSEYESINTTIENAYESRRLLSGTLEANETTYFSLRMWMDYDTLKEEGMNKIHSSKIVVSALNEKREDLDFFAITYTDESKEEGNNNWYKNYTTRVNITDTKSTNIKAKYCVGTTSCIPNAEIELENNSYIYEYTNGTSILCTQAEDSLGNRSRIVCNKEVKIDTEAPEISYEIGSNTLGSNNWYKNLDLVVKANDNKSEVSSIKYCVTTASTCTPTETVNASTKTITLNTNLSSQKVCATSTDNNNNTSALVCSSTYLVDKEPPTVNITNSSSTTNSVTINVSGSDTHSKIKAYYYSINNGTYQTGSTTKTFSNLNSGTNYTIKVYALDNAGNTSEVKTTTIKTQIAGKDLILSKNTIDTSRASGTFTSSFTANTAGKIFSAQDNDGTTYFFAGANPNNYVSFANRTWRIIRINGDGSIRLISDSIGTSTFASNYNSSGYLIYSNSVIKTYLDNWYNTNLKTNYGQYIDENTGFCNDRVVSSQTSSNNIYYRPYSHAVHDYDTNSNATYSCETSDYYTLTQSTKGNKKLTNPIGLITSAEAVFAGGMGRKSNTNYWLYTGGNYWTMSPGNHVNGAMAMVVKSDGTVDVNGLTNSSSGVRPVINLKADALTKGSGTASDPYRIN